MPRSPAEDKLQNFRFRVFEIAGGADVFAAESPVAGFNSVTIPGITIEIAEHRTGNKFWTEKYAGVPTVEDSTFIRGVVLGNTTLMDWVNKYRYGEPFRTDFEIRVYNQQAPGENPDDQYAAKIIFRNAIPNSIKLLGDLDATSSDVSLSELGVSCEELETDFPASVV